MLIDILCLSVGTLSSIPTALTRWTDECKVLDAESMHDCVAGGLGSRTFILKCCVVHHGVARKSQNQTCPPPVVKVPILHHLESLRDEELEERREKRRRQLAEEEESKQNERRASGVEQAREQSLQVRSWWLLEQFSHLDGSADVRWVHFPADFSDASTFFSTGFWDGNNQWGGNHCRYCHLGGLLLLLSSSFFFFFFTRSDMHQMQALGACRGMR